MKIRTITALGMLSALSIMAGSASSAGVSDADELHCIDLVRIDHTQVVDEQNILFYLRNGNIYLNRLSHRAPGLRPNQPIMFRTSTGRLCNHDIVTVLDTWGFGFTQRTSSGLGKFMPIDEARADALKRSGPDGVQAEPVEEN